MDSEDVVMDDAPTQWPSAKGNGKTKVVEQVNVVADADNLPW